MREPRVDLMTRFSSSPLTWIVIPTWNRRKDLMSCLASVHALEYEPKRIVVVDNGSTDGTIDAVADRYPAVERLSLPKNLGATGASNAGFDYALKRGAELVLRLDSDTTVDPGFLSNLVTATRRWPEGGILVGKILFQTAPERIWSVGARQISWNLGAVELRRGELDDPAEDREQTVDYAWSTGMLLTRRALEVSGGFDPDFFVYYEEADLCQRVRANGMVIVSVPTARMWHKIGQTSHTAWVARQWGRSKMLFFRKHSQGVHRWLLICYAYAYAFFRALFPREGVGNRGPLGAALFGLTDGLRYPLTINSRNKL